MAVTKIKQIFTVRQTVRKKFSHTHFHSYRIHKAGDSLLSLQIYLIAAGLIQFPEHESHAGSSHWKVRIDIIRLCPKVCRIYAWIPAFSLPGILTLSQEIAASCNAEVFPVFILIHISSKQKK